MDVGLVTAIETGLFVDCMARHGMAWRCVDIEESSRNRAYGTEGEGFECYTD